MRRKLLCVIAVLAIFTMTVPVFADNGLHKGWYKTVPPRETPAPGEIILVIRNHNKPAKNLHIVVVGEADLFGSEDLWIGYTGADGIARFSIYLHPDLTYNVYTTTGKIVMTQPITLVDQILNLGSFLVSDDGSAYAVLWL